MNCDGTEPDAVGFTATVTTQQPVTVAPGSAAQLSVTIQRVNGFTGAVQVTQGFGGPNGVSSNQLIIPEGSTTGIVTINIPASAPLGPTTIGIIAQADGYHSSRVDVSFVADFSPSLPAFDTAQRWRQGTVVAGHCPLDRLLQARR